MNDVFGYLGIYLMNNYPHTTTKEYRSRKISNSAEIVYLHSPREDHNYAILRSSTKRPDRAKTIVLFARSRRMIRRNSIPLITYTRRASNAARITSLKAAAMWFEVCIKNIIIAVSMADPYGHNYRSIHRTLLVLSCAPTISSRLRDRKCWIGIFYRIRDKAQYSSTERDNKELTKACTLQQGSLAALNPCWLHFEICGENIDTPQTALQDSAAL